MQVSLFILLVRGAVIVAVALGSSAWGNERVSAKESPSHPARINPATLLRQAIATVLPTQADSMRSRAASEAGMAVDFARGDESGDRVSLSLAQSRLRVRLGEGLQLNCEVSRHKALDAGPKDSGPKLGVDVGIQFKFR